MTIKPGLEYHIYHALWSGLDLFFPPSCGGCGTLGVRWCNKCQQKLVQVPLPLCEICGNSQASQGICKECQKSRPTFHALRSCFVYCEPTRLALIKLKYYRDIGLGEALAWNLAAFLDKISWKADMVIPIPLSDQRFAERGYNQVELIAHPMALLIRWNYNCSALRRTRHTASQVGLNAKERRKNVVGVFCAKSQIVTGKTILLVDDIATTGATLDSASHALLDAGAIKVYALTYAKALQNYGLDYS